MQQRKTRSQEQGVAEGSHHRHNPSLLQRETYLVPTLRKEKEGKKKIACIPHKKMACNHPSQVAKSKAGSCKLMKMNKVIPKPASRHHAALIRYFSFATAPEITNIYANTFILD